ncbi:hypothetical protein JW905_11910, partial [bacterium]|nr:hypothetical protein [candidate division CSSED10-310 bacterium]
MIHRIRILLPLLSICIALPAAAATLHVPGDYPDIQTAVIMALDGDTVLVADGTWTGTGNISVYLFTGYTITIRSENGPANCIIDCEDENNAFNIWWGDGPDTVIRGFTIRNGFDRDGAGIDIEASSPTITDCRFEHCWAYYRGGSIAVEGGAPVITDCSFTDGRAAFGGAVAILGESDPLIGGEGHGNRFEGNDAGVGMDLYCDTPHTPPIAATHNSFSGCPQSGFYVSPPE